MGVQVTSMLALIIITHREQWGAKVCGLSHPSGWKPVYKRHSVRFPLQSWELVDQFQAGIKKRMQTDLSAATAVCNSNWHWLWLKVEAGLLWLSKPMVLFWYVWLGPDNNRFLDPCSRVYFCACLGQCRSRLSSKPQAEFSFYSHSSPSIKHLLTKQRLRTIHIISVFAWTPPKTEIKADQLQALGRIRDSVPENHCVPSLSTCVQPFCAATLHASLYLSTV